MPLNCSQFHSILRNKHTTRRTVQRLSTFCGRFQCYLDGESTSDSDVVRYVIGSSWNASGRLYSQEFVPHRCLKYENSLPCSQVPDTGPPFRTTSTHSTPPTPYFFTIHFNAKVKAMSLVCLQSGFRQRHTKLWTVVGSGACDYMYVRMCMFRIQTDDSSQLGYGIV